MAPVLGGMEDVVAAQTSISSIDGPMGELRYRGYPVGELAERCTFEEVAFLLWNGELPTSTEIADLRSDLRRSRFDATRVLNWLADVPLDAHPLDVLRYAVARDALINPHSWDNSPAANLRKSIEFTAWFPTVTAAYHRLRHGKAPCQPRPDLDTAANFLYMLEDREPSEVATRTLDMSLILHAEHELNASTFSARVTIATQSNVHAAITSALGTLAGPRHGGASDRVIFMLEEIGSINNVANWVARELAARERIMGFGHRVYRTADPRSRHLRAMAEKLVEGTERAHWIQILDAIGEIMRKQRNLFPNVDLYAAVVNHSLGIDPAFYTSTFACSRIVGWMAHAIEQLDGRMIRPAAEYLGPPPRHIPALSRAGV